MKRFFRTLILGICWALPFLLAEIIFQIPYLTLLRYYLFLSGILIAGMTGFNLCYNLYYQKKMNAAAQLFKTGRTEEYIAEVESMRRRAKGRFAIQLCTVNLSAGYSNLKQYDKAVELLESLSDQKMSGVLKLVHRLNLCICYFYQKQTDRAMALYKDSQEIFRQYRNSKSYGGNIAILDIYAAVGAMDYTYAAQLLHTARSTWTNPRFLEDYQYLEEQIHPR